MKSANFNVIAAFRESVLQDILLRLYRAGHIEKEFSGAKDGLFDDYNISLNEGFKLHLGEPKLILTPGTGFDCYLNIPVQAVFDIFSKIFTNVGEYQNKFICEGTIRVPCPFEDIATVPPSGYVAISFKEAQYSTMKLDVFPIGYEQLFTELTKRICVISLRDKVKFIPILPRVSMYESGIHAIDFPAFFVTLAPDGEACLMHASNTKVNGGAGIPARVENWLDNSSEIGLVIDQTFLNQFMNICLKEGIISNRYDLQGDAVEDGEINITSIDLRLVEKLWHFRVAGYVVTTTADFTDEIKVELKVEDGKLLAKVVYEPGHAKLQLPLFFIWQSIFAFAGALLGTPVDAMKESTIEDFLDQRQVPLGYEGFIPLKVNQSMVTLRFTPKAILQQDLELILLGDGTVIN